MPANSRWDLIRRLRVKPSTARNLEQVVNLACNKIRRTLNCSGATGSTFTTYVGHLSSKATTTPVVLIHMIRQTKILSYEPRHMSEKSRYACFQISPRARLDWMYFWKLLYTSILDYSVTLSIPQIRGTWRKMAKLILPNELEKMWKEADVVFLIYPRICPKGVRILPWTYRKNEVLRDRIVQSGTHPKRGRGGAAGFQPHTPPKK